MFNSINEQLFQMFGGVERRPP